MRLFVLYGLIANTTTTVHASDETVLHIWTSICNGPPFLLNSRFVVFTPITQQNMVQLADAALPSYCHARPLPCAVLSAAPRPSSALQDMHLRVRDAVGLPAPGSGDEWPSEQCLQTRELEMIMVRVVYLLVVFA